MSLRQEPPGSDIRGAYEATHIGLQLYPKVFGSATSGDVADLVF